MNTDTTTEYPFPENLVSAIFGGRSVEVLNSDQLKGVKYILSTLGEREQAVIIKRFKDGYTLREVGEHLKLSPERIRQIEVKALRKLRHPSRFKYITDGYSIVSGEIEKALNRKYVALEEDRKNRLKEINDLLCKLERRVQIIKTLCGGNFELIMSEIYDAKSEIPGLRYNESIYSLRQKEKISVRTYNCLKWYYITKRGISRDVFDNLTVYDVSKLTRSEAQSIRNLGARSLMELEKTLAEHGMQFTPEEYF